MIWTKRTKIFSTQEMRAALADDHVHLGIVNRLETLLSEVTALDAQGIAGDAAFKKAAHRFDTWSNMLTLRTGYAPKGIEDGQLTYQYDPDRQKMLERKVANVRQTHQETERPTVSHSLKDNVRRMPLRPDKEGYLTIEAKSPLTVTERILGHFFGGAGR